MLWRRRPKGVLPNVAPDQSGQTGEKGPHGWPTNRDGRCVGLARAALGDAAFAEGRAMTLEAIEYALRVGEGDAVVTHSPHLEK